MCLVCNISSLNPFTLLVTLRKNGGRKRKTIFSEDSSTSSHPLDCLMSSPLLVFLTLAVLTAGIFILQFANFKPQSSAILMREQQQDERATFLLPSGHRMPAMGLGTWLMKKEGEAKAAVTAGLEAGFRHIDAAWVYKNEKEVGEAVRDFMDQGRAKREDLFITSKLWNTFHKPEDVLTALNASLTALGLEYLDLYLLHWPVAQDPSTNKRVEIPIAHTWAAMETVCKAGLVRDIGVSNFNPYQLRTLLRSATVRPAVNQVECHPLLPQHELLQFCATENMTVTAYCPLGSPGRDTKTKSEPSLLKHPSVLMASAAERLSPASVLLLWALQRGTAVIPKSVSKPHLTENVATYAAFRNGSLRLSEHSTGLLDAIGAGTTFRYITGEKFLRPAQTLHAFWTEP